MNPLEVSIAGIKLYSPLVLSSGILGVTASSLAMVAKNGAGAVTTKSFGLVERCGHPGPTVIPFRHGLLNAIGLSNPGIAYAKQEIADFRGLSNIPVFLSIFAGTIEEFSKVAAVAAESCPDLIEVNVSCPNVESEFGRPFGSDPKLVCAVTKSVKRQVGKIPISVKLTPNCLSIAETARAAEEGGADAITAINTAGPGMLIDLNVRKPILANLTGGISGHAIFPLAVRCIFEIKKVVNIPIIGGGGVETAEDALQLIMAGATAIGIGSGIYTKGLKIFKQINTGLKAFLKKKKISSITELVGAAHV